MAVIERFRGDTAADRIVVKDSSGAVVNVTGATFLLTINTSKAPTDTTGQKAQIAGQVVDAVNGVVDFPFDDTSSDQEPGTYFYDIQMTDSTGVKETLVLDKYIFRQDITKS